MPGVRGAVGAHTLVAERARAGFFFFKGKENFTDMLKMLKRGKPKPSKTQG